MHTCALVLTILPSVVLIVTILGGQSAQYSNYEESTDDIPLSKLGRCVSFVESDSKSGSMDFMDKSWICMDKYGYHGYHGYVLRPLRTLFKRVI